MHSKVIICTCATNITWSASGHEFCEEQSYQPVLLLLELPICRDHLSDHIPNLFDILNLCRPSSPSSITRYLTRSLPFRSHHQSPSFLSHFHSTNISSSLFLHHPFLPSQLPIPTIGDRNRFYGAVRKRGSAPKPRSKVNLYTPIAKYAILVGTAVLQVNPRGAGPGLLRVLNLHRLKKANPPVYELFPVRPVPIDSRQHGTPYQYCIYYPPKMIGEMPIAGSYVWHRRALSGYALD